MVIGKKVYCGGGSPFSRSFEPIDSNVCCYNSVEDNWTTLPQFSLSRFGLGQVNGKLVAVGGLNHDNVPSNEVHVYNDLLKTWKQEIPPMPTARYGAGVVSCQSALVVAGGDTRGRRFFDDLIGMYSQGVDTVEIFKLDTSQWYKTDPLHTTFNCVSGIVAVGNTCYILGYRCTRNNRWSQALCASVDDLLHNAVPANQTTHSSSDSQSAWKTLPLPPSEDSFPAELAGNLIAIGTNNRVYLFISSLKSWIKIGDNIPINEFFYTSLAVANLSPLEIIVFKKNVYKGTPVYI